jgi:hypothetical protein
MGKDFDRWNGKKKKLNEIGFYGYAHERDMWWCYATIRSFVPLSTGVTDCSNNRAGVASRDVRSSA